MLSFFLFMPSPFAAEPPEMVVHLDHAGPDAIAARLAHIRGADVILSDDLEGLPMTLIGPDALSPAEETQALYSLLDAAGITVVSVGDFVKLVDTSDGCHGMPPATHRPRPAQQVYAHVSRWTDTDALLAARHHLTNATALTLSLIAYQPTSALIVSGGEADVREAMTILDGTR